MGSNAGNSSAPMNGAGDRGSAVRPFTRTDAGLDGFLLGGLVASRETIERMLSLQKEMIDTVSRHALGPIGGDRPDLGPDEMTELVTALQSDDLIRQTYETLLRVLDVMVQAVEEGGDASDRDDRWTEALLETVQMDDLRRLFARRLGTSDSD